MKNIFLLIVIVLFVFMGFKTYSQYKVIEKTQELVVLNESKALSEFIMSFRKTYQQVFLRNNIEITEDTLKLLPVVTTREINDDFTKRMDGSIIIRTVSDRPRDMRNKANEKEKKGIDYFRENKTATEYFTEEHGLYTYMKPLIIDNSCLKCHGEEEKVLPIIKKNYDTAFGYKLGEIRGVLSISVEEREIFGVLYEDYIKMVAINALFYFLTVGFIYYLLEKIGVKEHITKTR